MSEYDPYRAPVADLGGVRSDSAVGNAAVPSEVVELLRQTKPWVTFLAVLGFIATGLMVLGGLIITAAGGLGGQKGSFPAALGLLYVGLGIFYVFPSLFLLRYGNAIRELTVGGGVPALTEAIKQQKSFWRLVGIMTVVMMCIYALVLVGMVIFGVATAMKH
jgi:hypothetical protein